MSKWGSLFHQLKLVGNQLEKVSTPKKSFEKSVKKVMFLLRETDGVRSKIHSVREKCPNQVDRILEKLETKIQKSGGSMKESIFPLLKHLIQYEREIDSEFLSSWKEGRELEQETLSYISEIESDLEEIVATLYKVLKRVEVLEEKFLMRSSGTLERIQKATSWLKGSLRKVSDLLDIAEERVAENSEIAERNIKAILKSLQNVSHGGYPYV